MRKLTDLVFALAGTRRRLSLFLLSGVLATSFASLLHGAIMIDMCRILDAGVPDDASRAVTVLQWNSDVWAGAYMAVFVCDVLLIAARIAVSGPLWRRRPIRTEAVLIGFAMQMLYFLFFGLRPWVSPATLAYDGIMTVIAVAAIAWLAVTPDARPA